MINKRITKIDLIAGELKIVISSENNLFELLLGAAWLGGWLLGLVSTLGLLFSETEYSDDAFFMPFYLIVWTVAGLAIITMLLWGHFGQEKFITKRNEILFEKSVFGIGVKNKLDIIALNNFRSETSAATWFGGQRNTFWGFVSGKIKFDYGPKTYSFGLGMDEEEAKHIVTLLRLKFETKKATTMEQRKDN